MALLRAAKKDEIPPGTIREFQLNGTTVAIANVDGKLYAINNTCLHRGGPLGEGELERQDRHVPLARLDLRRDDGKDNDESRGWRFLLSH